MQNQYKNAKEWKMQFTYHLHDLFYFELFYIQFIFKSGGGGAKIVTDNMQWLLTFSI